VNKGDRVELKIDDLAFDGKAVAHADGKVVFLDSGLPGETVSAEITRVKPRYNQGRVTEIITRSPDRLDAVCTHFGFCGGCTWQDLKYEQQLQFKKRHVLECLTRIGGLENVEVHDVLPSNDTFFYRNKMEFSFHTSGEDGFTLGLHHRGHFDQVFDLQRCHLQSETSNRIVHWLRDFVKDKSIPAYDVKRHTGYMRFLVVREAKRTGQVMVVIVTNHGEMPYAEELVTGMTSAIPDITTIVHGQNGARSNVAYLETESVLFGHGHIEEELLGMRFRIRANSFFQSNSEQAERLYQYGFELLAPGPEDRIMDLYCGTGTIGLLLAPRVSHVVGVESVPAAVEMARENAALNGLTNVTFVSGQVREYLQSLSASEQSVDAVIIDPPRAGLHPKALKRILKMRPPRLLYISCNPSTFARDARELAAQGYAISPVQPVDMFPHTRHIELVALFRV
jgi:23S rRNA (uracil1939-C5)-methyltransferase